MKLDIKYFAALREQVGKAGESIETTVTTPLELYRELTTKYNLTLSEGHVKVSVNLKYVSMDSPIVDGDQLVFIPPVAGG